MSAPIRVLVVDDSAFAWKVLRELLSEAPDLEVVGFARDGVDALERIAELKPEVITLDLVMPQLDGLGVLEALKGQSGPRAVIVSMSGVGTELGAAALLLGAVDLVHKPSALATSRLYEMRDELLAKVRAAAVARKPVPLPRKAVPLSFTAVATPPGVVVVGASTGGPSAIALLLSELPESLPWPLVVAVHLPTGYTDALAARLNDNSALEVLEAQDGTELKPGRAVLAQGGRNLELSGSALHSRVTLNDRVSPHHPSVDQLFESAARVYGRNVLGVVLTGMGNDGLQGAKAIKAAGGRILAQREASSVVYGMPRVIHENGLADGGAELAQMAATLLRFMPTA
ncbi:MAG: chemotaxis-specific protein-glutamate methyltransferase CheB [Myxococcaceae bacterium]